MNILSEEQKKIILESKKNQNLICNSVAGSGKTTTIIEIIKNNLDKNFLILTYNNILKKETSSKIKNITNVNCLTFHGFAFNFYNENCYDDKTLYNIIINDYKPKKDFFINSIIIDESQDLTLDLFNIIVKIIKDNSIEDKIQIIMFGDERQSIYQFRGSDENLFKNHNFNKVQDRIFDSWSELKLSNSFRITKQLSIFINEHLNYFNKDYKINSNKEGSKINFIKTSHSYISCSIEIIKYLISGYLEEDIFVIAPSINGRSNYNLIKLQELLTYLNIDIELSINEEKDKRTLKNKVVFSSIHGTKGLERKVVLFLNFDNNYFKYYNKINNDEHKDFILNNCHNVIYTGLTRSLEQLTLFSGLDENITDFNFIINNDNINNVVNFYYHNFYNSLSNIEELDNCYKKFKGLIYDKDIINDYFNNNLNSSNIININLKCNDKSHQNFIVEKSIKINKFIHTEIFCWKCKKSIKQILKELYLKYKINKEKTNKNILINKFNIELLINLKENLIIKNNNINYVKKNNKILNQKDNIDLINDKKEFNVSNLTSFINYKLINKFENDFKLLDYNILYYNEDKYSNYIKNLKLIIKQNDNKFENISSTLGNLTNLYLEYIENNNIYSIFNKTYDVDNYYYKKKYSELILKILYYLSKDLYNIYYNSKEFNKINNINDFKKKSLILIKKCYLIKYGNIEEDLNKKKKLILTILIIISEYILKERIGYTHRFIRQINNYDFIDISFLEMIEFRYQNFLNYLNIKNNKFIFEEEIKYKDEDDNILYGIVDIIDYENKKVIEIKFKNDINDEDLIQVLLYNFILYNCGHIDFDYYIFNLKINKLIKLNNMNNIIILKEMFNMLIKKY